MFSFLLSVKLQPWSVALLVLVDVLLCALIVYKVAYTEIDWKAYMEEVEGYLSGERDYTKIQGNTGPLVYPAGFLYIFTYLRMLTENGTNIFTAQCIFIVVYVLSLMIVLALYLVSGVPLFASALLLLSKRVHSIYMLRMFNDCIAVLCGYVAIWLFTRNKYRAGCLIYSLGVGVKMNMLLYAPGVLLVLLMHGGYIETVICLSICAGLQLVMGAPFLLTYPKEYLTKAFELNRVFMYKWTVNYKFLPEAVFVSKPLSLLLLALTVLGFIMFAYKWILEIQQQQLYDGNKKDGKQTSRARRTIIGLGTLNPQFIAYTIFTSNFIGIAFARTLHYQFYCWYFHTLPYLLFLDSSSLIFTTILGVPVATALKLALLLAIEICFNVYPATPWSSTLLQTSHVIVMIYLYAMPVPAAVTTADSSRGSDGASGSVVTAASTAAATATTTTTGGATGSTTAATDSESGGYRLRSRKKVEA